MQYSRLKLSQAWRDVEPQVKDESLFSPDGTIVAHIEVWHGFSALSAANFFHPYFDGFCSLRHLVAATPLVNMLLGRYFAFTSFRILVYLNRCLVWSWITSVSSYCPTYRPCCKRMPKNRVANYRRHLYGRIFLIHTYCTSSLTLIFLKTCLYGLGETLLNGHRRQLLTWLMLVQQCRQDCDEEAMHLQLAPTILQYVLPVPLYGKSKKPAWHISN